MTRAVVGASLSRMVPFAIGFLVVFLARAEIPEVGRMVAVAAVAAVVIARLTQRGPRGRASAVTWVAMAAGALAACAPHAARDVTPRRGAETLDARGAVARVEGVVEGGGRVDGRGAVFRLRGGPMVRVAGARLAPPPLTTVAVIGRLDAARTTLAAASTEAITFVARAPPVSVTGVFESIRTLCRERIGAACPPDVARVLLPLLIGDAGLPEDFREDLARTGTLHIVAVSGTHLSLFLAGLRVFTRRLRILLPLLFLYTGLCAFQAPVLRSFVLAAGYLCGRRLGRALPEGAHFLLSACVVLACDPDALFDAGFQLSFSAFGGIIALGGVRHEPDPFEHARQRGAGGAIRRLLRPAARAGAGATLATAPSMIWRFNRISPIGIPATLLLSPFIPVLLWLGALIVIFPDVRAFARLASALIHLLVGLSGILASVPLAAVDVARPHAIGLAGFTGAVLLLALRRPARWSARSVAFACAAALFVAVPDRAPAGAYQLAAGRGAATLLLTDDAAVLVDAGPPRARVPEQILKLGVRAVDLVVITHGHEDHAGGLPGVEARLAVGCVAAGPTFPRRRVTTWHAGDSFRRGALRVTALWPPADFRGAANDRSLVLSADAAGLRVLLCGDVESTGLTALLAAGPLPRADVLLLPHHGSANDATCDLLLRARPAWLLLSARAGAPSEETLRTIGLVRARILATYVDGPAAVEAASFRRP